MTAGDRIVLEMAQNMQTLQLRSPPEDLAGPVRIRQGDVVPPTWEFFPGGRNPMSLEQRLSQGSGGCIRGPWTGGIDSSM